MKLKGVDISYWNGSIDFDTLKKNVDFVMIRAGTGLQLDTNFRRNISECNRVGLPCGIYWFCYALNENEARAEARLALSVVKDYLLEYPIAYDLEDDSVAWAQKNGVNLNADLAVRLVNAFLDEVRKGGYYGINYTNLNFINNYGMGNVKCDLWLALWSQYYSGDTPPRTCTLWQYSSTGRVNGISTNVDMNWCYVDYPTLIANAGMNNLEKREWWEADWEWGIENGITDGTNPTKNIKRNETVAMLHRLYNLIKGGK